RPLTGAEISAQVKGIQTVFGKSEKTVVSAALYKKESIFWKLSYWREHDVRHCHDVMHIEKNVCDALLGTLMNIPGKTKDGKGARLDLKEMGIRPELWPQEKVRKGKEPRIEDENVSKKGKEKSKGKGRDEKNYLPPACYTLSRVEKCMFCACLYGIKVPSGYSSNMKRFVTLN